METTCQRHAWIPFDVSRRIFWRQQQSNVLRTNLRILLHVPSGMLVQIFKKHATACHPMTPFWCHHFFVIVEVDCWKQSMQSTVHYYRVFEGVWRCCWRIGDVVTRSCFVTTDHLIFVLFRLFVLCDWKMPLVALYRGLLSRTCFILLTSVIVLILLSSASNKYRHHA